MCTSCGFANLQLASKVCRLDSPRLQRKFVRCSCRTAEKSLWADELVLDSVTHTLFWKSTLHQFDSASHQIPVQITYTRTHIKGSCVRATCLSISNINISYRRLRFYFHRSSFLHYLIRMVLRTRGHVWELAVRYSDYYTISPWDYGSPPEQFLFFFSR